MHDKLQKIGKEFCHSSFHIGFGHSISCLDNILMLLFDHPFELVISLDSPTLSPHATNG